MKSIAMKWAVLVSAVLLELPFVGCNRLVYRSEREYEYKVSRHPPPPGLLPPTPTASLTSDKEVIVEGEAITLRWHTENATAVRIDQIGPVSGSGSLSLTPTSTTTKYRLVAKGPGGVDVATIWIKVMPLVPMRQ
jgi:hypothetical protein